MDLLTDIFDTLDLSGALYFRTDFNSPWAVEVPELRGAARFHLVVQGNCHLSLKSGQQLHLQPGDLILIPRGNAHVLADSPCQSAPALETLLKDLGYDGKGVLIAGVGDPQASTQMVCGHFSFRRGADHPLLKALPDYIYTTAGDRAKEPLLDELLRLISRRIFSEDLGCHATITRMSEIVFIELIRANMQHSPQLKMLLAGFTDKQIGKALEFIHQQPQHNWTLESLAREVGMSRSRFAERFHQQLGITPMAYLAEWRLQKSLKLLENMRTSVQLVSSQVGYQSPAAFTRAFAKRFGESPKQYQKAG